MITIKDITGATVEVTDLDKAIEQCEMCAGSPFRMPSGHTVGENHTFMLGQLEKMRRDIRRSNITLPVAMKITNGELLTNMEMGREMEPYKPFAPARHNWDRIEREDMVTAFNTFFGTDIK